MSRERARLSLIDMLFEWGYIEGMGLTPPKIDRHWVSIGGINSTFGLERALGNVPGITNFGFTGHCDFIGQNDSGDATPNTGYRTVWEAGGSYVEPVADTGEALEIVSSSANDNASGTGARLISISFYSEDDRTYKSESVTMNGTTPVALTATDWYGPGTLLTIFNGTSLKNEGLITLRRISDSVVRGQIPVLKGIGYSGLYKIPPGFNIGITSHYFNTGKDDDVTLRNVASIGREFFSQEFTFGQFRSYQSSHNVNNGGDNIVIVPGGADFKLEAKSNNAGTGVEWFYFGILIDTSIVT